MWRPLDGWTFRNLGDGVVKWKESDLAEAQSKRTSELLGLKQHREARLQVDKSMPPNGGGQWRDPGCPKAAQNGSESRGVWRVKWERDTE